MPERTFTYGYPFYNQWLRVKEQMPYEDAPPRTAPLNHHPLPKRVGASEGEDRCRWPGRRGTRFLVTCCLNEPSIPRRRESRLKTVSGSGPMNPRRPTLAASQGRPVRRPTHQASFDKYDKFKCSSSIGEPVKNVKPKSKS